MTRVRAALGGEVGGRFPLPSVYPVREGPPAGSRQLIGQFASEFEKVGGVIASTDSSVDVFAYIEKVLPVDRSRSHGAAQKGSFHEVPRDQD
ncbi:MAG TPA: hypothetical protein VEZ90_01085, partial [Blastocatellia bacterium]|nr:hypothetical protein [Blastocatellia bacterium]